MNADLRIGCVIMASGLSRRFGGNKLMASFHAEPMIARILHVTDARFARRLVVTRHEDVAAFCRTQGVDVLLHNLPLRSDTVRLGLEALQDMDGCMFCPADQPLLTQETVAALLQAFMQDSKSIWRPACGGTPGAPVLFPTWAFDELLSLSEGKGGGYIANKYPERVRLLPVRDPYELMDADTPQALSILLER